MLDVIIPASEGFIEAKNEFVYFPEVKLSLEHSLISISKWEGRWKIPWFSKEEKTIEQTLDYVKCMTLNKGVPEDAYDRIPSEVLDQIVKYINDPMTATTINRKNQGQGQSEKVTAEIIYYWMTAFNIPSEYQKWHVNKLLALIEVCSIKTQPQKKMSRQDTAKMYRDLNAARRARYNTKG